MADNGLQLFVACGSEGFVYNFGTGVLDKIVDVDFPGASSVAHVDGYFCFTEPLTQKLWWSALFDGSDIDALNYSSAEGHPDNVVALKALHRELWLFGSDSIEVFYNTGDPAAIFARMQGAFIETGCLAPESVARLDNSLFWLGRNHEGQGVVFKGEGYAARRVSTHAIETAISQSSAPTQATGFSYQQRGHSFYVLNLPERSFVYDVSTNLWHERATWNNGTLQRYRADNMAQLGPYILVGDYLTGGVYVLDPDYRQDAGGPLPWLRAWRALPPGQNKGELQRHSTLTVFMEGGVGNDDEKDPVVSLRWSDDGGHSWSNYHEKEAGKVGEYGKRVIWRRLGATRDRVYEISGSDPVKTAIVGADLV
jgi:hypothetical protein